MYVSKDYTRFAGLEKSVWSTLSIHVSFGVHLQSYLFMFFLQKLPEADLESFLFVLKNLIRI